ERPGVTIKAIAGTVEGSQGRLQGRISREKTEPIYLDIEVEQASYAESFSVPDGWTVLVYVYEGQAEVAGTSVSRSRMARLSAEGAVTIKADAPARILLIAGKPLKEPIVH